MYCLHTGQHISTVTDFQSFTATKYFLEGYKTMPTHTYHRYPALFLNKFIQHAPLNGNLTCIRISFVLLVLLNFYLLNYLLINLWAKILIFNVNIFNKWLIMRLSLLILQTSWTSWRFFWRIVQIVGARCHRFGLWHFVGCFSHFPVIGLIVCFSFSLQGHVELGIILNMEVGPG
jgi:hypothetical protein